MAFETPAIADFTELSKNLPSSLSFAQDLDNKAPNQRSQFVIPLKGTVRSPLAAQAQPSPDDSEPAIYLAGNSLGLLSRPVIDAVNAETEIWGSHGVLGHFAHPIDKPWVKADAGARWASANIVGAMESEVAVMGTLTANIHMLFAGFYKPTKERYKIIMEEGCFPSDYFAITSQIEHHGLDPKDALVPISPPPGQAIIPLDLILQTITHHASNTSIIFLSPVHYLTGQYHDIHRIVQHAHSHNILVGLDLAHAAGNVPLELHSWGVDFAAWCTYKYLNAGPGSIAGIFVHEKHFDTVPPGFKGWWGHDDSTRFQMKPQFVPEFGANSWRVSNPSVRDCAAVEASLSVFRAAGGINKLRERSLRLTEYLQHLLLTRLPAPRRFEIITPEMPWRGAQLSLKIRGVGVEILEERLMKRGVVVDTRKPDIVRVAPAPLYNTYEDVWGFVEAFKAVWEEVEKEGLVKEE